MPYSYNPFTGNLDYYKKSVPAGNNLEIQFNNNGVFGSNINFTFDGTSLKLPSGAKLIPSSNSTTAINIAQADGTPFVTFDTTNKRVSIGSLIAPTTSFHLQGTTASHIATIDTGINLAPVTRPPAFTNTLAGVGGGLMSQDAHYYMQTYVTALGETNQSSQSGGETFTGGVGASVTPTAGDGKVNVTYTASTDYRVTSINIYRLDLPNYDAKLVANVANTSGTFLDNVANAARTGTDQRYCENTTNRQVYIGTYKAVFLGLTNTTFGVNAGTNLNSLSTRNTFIGRDAGADTTSGQSSTYVGNQAGGGGGANSTDSVAVGYFAGRSMTGNTNVYVGSGAGFAATTGSGNTAVGTNAGYSIAGALSNRVLFGNYAGRYDTQTRTLFIDGLDRGTESFSRVRAMVYGLLSTTPTAQTLWLNNGNTQIADYTSVGTEKLTNGTFTGSATGWTLGTGWAYGTNNVVKTAGTGTLSQASAGMATPLVVGEMYYLSLTMSARSAGSLTISIGGYTSTIVPASNASFSFTFVALSTADLVLTPSASGDAYTIDDISLKKVTGGNLTIGGNMRAMGTFNYPVLAAGSATAGTAPLKFTSGTDLTTAETGAVEYDGTNLHFTPTGTLRENIHFGSKGSGTLTAGTTSTITDAIAKTTSVIMIQSTSAAITLLGVYVSTKNNGTFVLTHGVAAGTETFDYMVVN